MSILNSPNAIEICNQALTILGEGRCISSFSDETPEGEICQRLFPQAVNSCLEFANWSFSRKDEVITPDDILEGVVSLPYKYSCALPSDVLRILYLCPVTASADIETKFNRDAFQFNFRNYDGKKILVTNASPSFAIHYQAYITDLSVCSPMFIEGLSHMLAYKLSTAIIKGTEGFRLGSAVYKIGFSILHAASQLDAQQGSYAIDKSRPSRFLEARK